MKMAYSLTVPTAAVMDAWGTIDDARSWAGVTAEEWDKVSTIMGESGFSSLPLLASITDDDWEEARAEAKLPMVRRAALN